MVEQGSSFSVESMVVGCHELNLRQSGLLLLEMYFSSGER